MSCIVQICSSAFITTTWTTLLYGYGPSANNHLQRDRPLLSSFLPTAFNTDWLLEYGDESDGYLIRSVPRAFTNTTCNCMISGKCQEALRIGPPGIFLPGLVVGCLPFDGLRMSTLECLLSSICISTILTYLEYYTQIDGSPPIKFIPPTVLPWTISPLDDSIPSRFSKNTSIGTLIDEFFIEEWTNTSSYEDYFAACAPTHCNFEYVTRNNLLYVPTSVLGLYGGLTIGLRFIIWNMTRIYQLMKRRIQSRRVAAQL
ncbi:unnamed protein product [Rotaria sp. Silwood2]|nr:unnamed protein product [Rotaria sp. Silwood2]CAF4444053.1 unnamed protein product [Rotaria sp. Silwood2]